MTRIAAIGQVAMMYATLLGNAGIQPACHNTEGEDDTKLSTIKRMQHIRWMCMEIVGWASRKNPEAGLEMKAQRWLCFVQGVLWVHGYRTINQMREDNLTFLKYADEPQTIGA